MRQHRFYKDEFGFLLETSRSWQENPDNGRGDAVGRTVLAAIVYRKKDFIEAIRINFCGFIFGGEWNPKRHPENPRTKDFSRDHTTWFVVWLRYFWPRVLYRAKGIPFRISDRAVQSIDMWLWIRVLSTGRWHYKLFYWAYSSIECRVINFWNNFLRSRAGIKSEEWETFRATPQKDLHPEEWDARQVSVPAYSIEIKAWMVKCLPDGWFKNRMKKRIIPLVEPSNFLVRMLMDDELSFEDKVALHRYTGMDAYRWTWRLDKTTPIDLYPLDGPQPEYNMDVDVLYADLDITGDL